MAFGDVTMELGDKHVGDVTIITVKGRLTIGQVEQLNDFLLGLLDQGYKKYIFDLNGMEHIVSGAIGVLIGFNEKLSRADGMARLARLHPKVLRIFNLMALDEFFMIFDTVEEALNSFGTSPPSESA
ncbi:MAG: STAS domain-containing protein [Planctomycetota bacterium]|jgi:anti-anti-sigma factor